MSTNATRPKKDTDCIAPTETELDALKARAGKAIKGRSLIGIDAEGAIHFFSMATRQVAVFEYVGDTDPDVWDLTAEPIEDKPIDWAVHVARQRGLWHDLRLSTRASELFEADQ